MENSRLHFSLDFCPLLPDRPELGSISLVPWDSDIFEVPVASLSFPNDESFPEAIDSLPAVFHTWCADRRVSLCHAALSPAAHNAHRALRALGFHYVDTSLNPVLPNVLSSRLPPPRLPVRLAQPQDTDAILSIAASSFHHGRYHADPLFPKALADKRYRVWIHNTLRQPRPSDTVFVLEYKTSVAGFFHVSIDGSHCDMRLAAMDPSYKSSLLGVELYSSTVAELQRQGIRKITTTISATNTPVLNLFSTLGFHFAQPQLVFHWHAGTWR